MKQTTTHRWHTFSHASTNTLWLAAKAVTVIERTIDERATMKVGGHKRKVKPELGNIYRVSYRIEPYLSTMTNGTTTTAMTTAECW